MLDIKIIRGNMEQIVANCRNRQIEVGHSRVAETRRAITAIEGGIGQPAPKTQCDQRSIEGVHRAGMNGNP